MSEMEKCEALTIQLAMDRSEMDTLLSRDQSLLAARILNTRAAQMRALARIIRAKQEVPKEYRFLLHGAFDMEAEGSQA